MRCNLCGCNCFKAHPKNPAFYLRTCYEGRLKDDQQYGITWTQFEVKLDTLQQYIHLMKNDFGYQPKPPKEPTSAMPGSETKVRILQSRIDRGEALWHPDDRVIEWEGVRL